MRRPPENREDRPGAFDHFLHRPPDDVDEELDAHFAGTVDILVERGLDPREAWNEATRRFGDVERYRKRLRRIYRRRRLRGMMNEWVGGIWKVGFGSPGGACAARLDS